MGFAGLYPHNRTERPDKCVEVISNSVAAAGSIPASSTKFKMNAEDWHIPVSNGNITLRQSLTTMESFKLDQKDIPLIIQLVENPKYDIGIFPGCVYLFTHDCIHILLGRGVLLKDEAFVIGFTMGCTGRISQLKQGLFLFASKYLYPQGYEFFEEEEQIFRDSIRLPRIMKCKDITSFDFKTYLDKPLSQIRKELDIDVDLLSAYYKIEKRNNMGSKECRRLLKF